MRFEKSREDIVCISAVRTPFGRFGGSLREIDVYELGAIAMRNVMERIKLDPAIIDELWWGVGDTSSAKDPYTPVTARQSLLRAGISANTPSVTFDQACISGMNAAKYGLRSIQMGEAETVLSGGATSFSTIPFLLRGIRWEGRRHTSMTLEDPLIPLGYKDFAPVAVDAGEEAVQYEVTRLEQDEFACASHLNYGKAWKGDFSKAKSDLWNWSKPTARKISSQKRCSISTSNTVPVSSWPHWQSCARFTAVRPVRRAMPQA